MKQKFLGSRQVIVSLCLVLVLVGLFILLFWLRGMIQEIRRQTAAERLAIDARLDTIQHIAQLRELLNVRTHDIDRLLTMVPTKNSLTEVLSDLEEEAGRLNVKVTVPTIETVASSDAEPVFDLVQLSVVVIGEPVGVLNFFQKIEYLPYLSGVNSFDFTATSSTTPSGGAALIPGVGPPGARQDSAPERISGELRLNLLVALQKESI